MNKPTHFLPLYMQVKELLIQRLIDKVWLPGSPLPSEFQLADELQVSQGTVRKASMNWQRKSWWFVDKVKALT